MSRWFQDRRQEFIFATFKHFGQVNRDQIVQEFDVSVQQASKDIQDFLAANPGFVKYDVSAKSYVLASIPDQGGE